MIINHELKQVRHIILLNSGLSQKCEIIVCYLHNRTTLKTSYKMKTKTGNDRVEGEMASTVEKNGGSQNNFNIRKIGETLKFDSMKQDNDEFFTSM